MPNVVWSRKLESYLQQVRAGLGGLPSRQITEIIQELRSHVLDCADGDLSDTNLEATLARLGAPDRLARANLQPRALFSSDHPGDRPSIAWVIVDLVALGVECVLALIVSILGYGFAACWLITAVLKPMAPSKIGLWVLPDPTGDLSLSLGRHGAEVVGHDVFGWWIVPIGMAIGIGVGLLTYRFDVLVVRKSIQNRFKRPELLQ